MSPARGLARTRGQRRQQRVAGVMTQQVVDILEAVQVQE
jgi:hypothetical protein